MPRERLILLVLVVALVGGLGFAAFALVISPLVAAGKAKTDLQAKVQADETALTVLKTKNARLAALYDRSLPADQAFATKEYEDTLVHLLRESGLRSVNYSVSAQAVNAKDIPVLSGVGKDQKFAYAKIGFSVKLTGVTLTQLTTFLSKYYALGLLHHVVKLDVSRPDTTTVGEDKRELEQRNDLTVTLVTEAIILDGAPARKTLIAVPKANGAVLGGYGLFALEQNPEQGRGITPQQLTTALATPARDYHLLAGRDVFHGPLPVPPPPEKEKPPPVVPPKPDYSDFIKRVWANRTVDEAAGTVTAEVLIYDQANQEDYRVTLVQKGEKLTPSVVKYYYKPLASGGGKAKFGTEPTLDISNASMRTKRSFTVYGLDGKGLILGEKPSADAKDKPDVVKDKAPPKVGGGSRPPTGGSKPAGGAGDPMAAAIGGMAEALPPPAAAKGETVFRWEEGQSLKQMTEKPLSKTDGEKAVQRAKTGLLDTLPASGPKPEPPPMPKPPSDPPVAGK